MVFSEGDKQKPYIGFDAETSYLTISGSSFPENADNVYVPVLQWLNELDFSNLSRISLRISLKYYNTASSKKLFEIIKKLNDIYSDGHKAEVLWEYFTEDDDMFESGRYFSELVEIPFRFIEIAD